MINSAYDSLTPLEREAVNQYVQAVELYAIKNNEQLIHALNRPIPPEVIARSRGMLEKPLVLAAIYDKIRDLANEKDLSAKRVLREHMLLATSNMADYVDIDLRGNIRINVENCTREQMACIKSLKVNNTLFGCNVEIQLHNKEAHLTILSKMMGIDQPDNPVYLEHIAKPKDVKALPATATPQDAEKDYMQLLETMRV